MEFFYFNRGITTGTKKKNKQRRFAPTRLSEITGLAVQIPLDSVSGFDWIHRPDSVEYAIECSFMTIQELD